MGGLRKILHFQRLPSLKYSAESKGYVVFLAGTHIAIGVAHYQEG
jgi:hypothetical protein